MSAMSTADYIEVFHLAEYGKVRALKIGAFY